MTKNKAIELSFNFAEANITDKSTKRDFRDYIERNFLVGYCKSETKKWIYSKRLYNIRPESAKRRGGIDEKKLSTFAVDYVILYENSCKNKYRIYTVQQANVRTIEEMRELEYPCEPKSNYIVFTLGEEVKFEDLDLMSLLDKELGEQKHKPVYLSGHSLFSCYRIKARKRVGLVDADLLCNGTRHPNLALLKIAGYLFDNNISFELITEPNADISQYAHIYMSRVFTFTEEPAFYLNASTSEKKKFHLGGTGYYANEKSISKFRNLRKEDMSRLSHDSFLNTLTCKHTGKQGINMAVQMPYYNLYNDYVDKQVELGFRRDKYKDYFNYSIGFLTRQCFRHCPFCVNKLEDSVIPYSKLEWFHDKKRPHVYFWDDNFLAAPYHVWKPALQYLIDNNISFQFRQGLDERLLAEDEHGEEMAAMLGQTRYHGDFIYAFDNWKDKEIIERALKIWKRNCPKKGTKFYLFCGFMQEPDKLDKFYRDIWELFQRIKILMQYGCVGYVMRHEDYKKSPLANIYVQIARWCNQQQFYKKMSFWEFCYRNQSYWEEQQTRYDASRPQLMSFEEFIRDVKDGVYGDGEGKIKMCLPLKTLMNILEMFPHYRRELVEMFNYKMENLITPQLWEKDK